MAIWGKFKILSLFITALFAQVTIFTEVIDRQLGAYLFFAILTSFLFSHYILSFTATKKQFLSLLRRARGRWQLGCLLLVALVSSLYEPELSFVYFAIHYALSDVYSRFLVDGDRSFFVDTSITKRVFRTIHCLFLVFLFLFAHYHILDYVLRLSFLRTLLPLVTVNSVVIFLGVAYFLFLFVKRKDLFVNASKNVVLFGYVLPEVCLIFFSIWCHVHRLHWSTTILYHITFWFFLPLFTRSRRDPHHNTLVKYVIPTVAITFLAFLFYPDFMEGNPINPEELNFASVVHPFTGYYKESTTDLVVISHRFNMSIGIFHILLSFVLSTLNPTLVRQLATKDLRDPLQA